MHIKRIQSLSQPIAVIVLISDQNFYALSGSSSTSVKAPRLFKLGLDQSYLCRKIRSKYASKMHALRVHYHHSLHIFALLCLADPKPLFLPVRNFSLQSLLDKTLTSPLVWWKSTKSSMLLETVIIL
jgi:hypothetical protein